MTNKIGLLHYYRFIKKMNRNSEDIIPSRILRCDGIHEFHVQHANLIQIIS